MPVCPDPSLVGRSKAASSSACGIKMVKPSLPLSMPTPPLADFAKWYRYKENYNEQSQYDASGTIFPGWPHWERDDITYSRDESGNCDAVATSDSEGVIFGGSYPSTGSSYSGGVFESTYDSRGPFPSAGFSGLERITYSDGLDNAAATAEIEAAIETKFAALSWTSPGATSSSRESSQTSVSALYPGETMISGIFKTKAEARFRIPSTHLGSYFKITYDIAEFPSDGITPASFVSEDNVIEWFGPGDVGSPSGESWLTPWFAIDPPDQDGERRVVNIRYTCYHGTKYGVKTQVTGESFTPPAP